MTTAEDEAYYRSLSDEQLVSAYLSYLDTYRSGRNESDRDFDRKRIVLIYGVAREQGRERVIDDAVAKRRQSQATASER